MIGHQITEGEISSKGKPSSVSSEVVDYLEPKEDPGYDYTKDLMVLEEMWVEKLQPFDEKGYNKKKKIA